jgi:hypothetical protein
MFSPRFTKTAIQSVSLSLVVAACSGWVYSQELPGVAAGQAQVPTFQSPQPNASSTQSTPGEPTQEAAKAEPAAFKYIVDKRDLWSIEGGFVTLTPGEDSFWKFTDNQLSEHEFPGLEKKRTIKIPELSHDDRKMGASIHFADHKTIVLAIYSKLIVIDLATAKIVREIHLERDEYGNHPSDAIWVILDADHILGYDNFCLNIRTGKSVKWPIDHGVYCFLPQNPIKKGDYFANLNVKKEPNATDSAPCQFRVVIEVSQVGSDKPPLVVPTNFRAGTHLLAERVYPDMQVIIAKNRYLIWSAKSPTICEPKVTETERPFGFDLQTKSYLNILGSDTYTLNNSWHLELDQSGGFLTVNNHDGKIILVDVEQRTILASVPISKFKPVDSSLDDYSVQLTCQYSRKHNAILYGCLNFYEVILLSPRPR